MQMDKNPFSCIFCEMKKKFNYIKTYNLGLQLTTHNFWGFAPNLSRDFAQATYIAKCV